VPTVFQRTSFELGVAAGPALVGSVNKFYYRELPPGVRKTVLCGRIRGAWDYYFAPAFSLGAFLEYRFEQTRAPAKVDEHTLDFYVEDGAAGEHIVRLTEFVLPPVLFRARGIHFGLRIGLRL
jgi:hypothetical protein